MFRSSVVLLGLAGMALADQNLALTSEEREAVLAMRSRREGTVDPIMTTRDGNLVTSVGEGADVIFELGNETLSLNQLPADLRGYTNAAVDALDTGFKIGRAQGEAEGRNYANEAELRLLGQINEMGQQLSTTESTLASTQLSASQAASDVAAQQLAAVSTMISNANTTATAAIAALTNSLAPRGLTSNNPIQSCMQMNPGMSAFYYVRPAAAPANSSPVRVWCDARWGGGWVQIFHGQGWQYKQQWTARNERRAYGGVPSPDASNATNALSKLSDEFINQYLGLTSARNTKAVYRFSSDCHGPGSGRVAPNSGGFGMFFEANMRQYDDRKTGMGISINRPKYLFGYGPGKLYSPRWWGGSTYYFDTPHDPSHMLGTAQDNTMRIENNCLRWFQGHTGPRPPANSWGCYNPRSGSRSEKCFSHGQSCICDGQGNHPQAQGVMIFAKTRADYGFIDGNFRA